MTEQQPTYVRSKRYDAMTPFYRWHRIHRLVTAPEAQAYYTECGLVFPTWGDTRYADEHLSGDRCETKACGLAE